MIDAGIFVVDKPVGITSFKVVSRFRKVLQMKKIGHAGTLDPFASGLLVVCAGRPATKLISAIMEGEKEYIARIKLGVSTTTQDTEGELVALHEVGVVTDARIKECLRSFQGEQMQTPPAFSALKHEGKPLYYYARKGIMIEKPPRAVNISVIERVNGHDDLVGDYPEFDFRVQCSKGTYIRTLGFDIGTALGYGGHLTGLRRTMSGRFNLDNCLNWQELSAENALETCLQKMINVSDAWNMLQ